jgi:hypothetical protein
MDVRGLKAFFTEKEEPVRTSFQNCGYIRCSRTQVSINKTVLLSI